jgi:hypothetical protein
MQPSYFCPQFERGADAWENYSSLKNSWVLIFEFEGFSETPDLGWMMKAVLSHIKCPVVIIASCEPPNSDGKYGVDLREYCLVVNAYEQCKEFLFYLSKFFNNLFLF